MTTGGRVGGRGVWESTGFLYIGPPPSSLGRMNECEKQATKISRFILYYIIQRWLYSFIVRQQTGIYNYGRYVYKADTTDIYENTQRSVQGFFERNTIILATSLITAIRSLAFASKLLRPEAGWAGILISRHTVSNIPSDSLPSNHRLHPASFSTLKDGGRLVEIPHHLAILYGSLPATPN